LKIQVDQNAKDASIVAKWIEVFFLCDISLSMYTTC
jgi:hypothetical protein